MPNHPQLLASPRWSLKVAAPLPPHSSVYIRQRRSAVRRASLGDSLPGAHPNSKPLAWTAARPRSVPSNSLLPPVDWSRHHVQVLFVDQTDVLRARLVSGWFERVAEWSGWGRCLLSATAGVGVDAAAADAQFATRASLMAQASYLGLPGKLFSRAPEPYDADFDLDVFDVVVAVDCQTRAELLRSVAGSEHYAHYASKVSLLSDYAAASNLSDEELLAKGGLALLPRAMSTQLGSEPDLAGLRGRVDLPRPALADGGDAGLAAWRQTVLQSMLGAAGVVRYLMAAYPQDMPHWAQP